MLFRSDAWRATAGSGTVAESTAAVRAVARAGLLPSCRMLVVLPGGRGLSGPSLMLELRLGRGTMDSCSVPALAIALRLSRGYVRCSPEHPNQPLSCTVGIPLPKASSFPQAPRHRQHPARMARMPLTNHEPFLKLCSLELLQKIRLAGW